MNSEVLRAELSCPRWAPGVGGTAPLVMTPTRKVFHMTQIKKMIFFNSLFHFNTLLVTWKGVLMPGGLPLLAASWMGDAKSQGGCRLAPCCSNKFKQATLPLTQALNNGVCQSTVAPFTWGKNNRIRLLFFCLLSISKLMKILQFPNRKQGPQNFLFNTLQKLPTASEDYNFSLKRSLKKSFKKLPPSLSSCKRMSNQCRSRVSQELVTKLNVCPFLSYLSWNTPACSPLLKQSIFSWKCAAFAFFFKF